MRTEPWEEPAGKTEPIKKTRYPDPTYGKDDPILTTITWKQGEPIKDIDLIEMMRTRGVMDKMPLSKFLPPELPRFLDTLVFRDDLSKYQIRMAERSIENLRGMMSAGWIVEE